MRNVKSINLDLGHRVNDQCGCRVAVLAIYVKHVVDLFRQRAGHRLVARGVVGDSPLFWAGECDCRGNDVVTDAISSIG